MPASAPHKQDPRVRPVSRALLSGVIDYAGLFPPAALSMRDAVLEYRDARAVPSAWMLGRFVVPAQRLAELCQTLESASIDEPPWRVSAVVRDGCGDDIDAILTCNARPAAPGVRIDCVECKPQTLAGVDWLARGACGLGEIYVEIAVGPDAHRWLAHVANLGLRAKVRTGGATVDAIPPPRQLAAFFAQTVQHKLPFKATAGLHHAVRGTHLLTSEPGALTAPMHGYLNVLLATAALHGGARVATATMLLEHSDAATLFFDDQIIRWRGEQFSACLLTETRRQAFRSFGSCSFREPVAEFTALVRD